ncbi:MAG: LLM class flavin-dependent oxidoreductase, partial [Rhodospirillales bacterium]|nr:LLM class flavin-dependent oxidoreductase [Rhodospirillales bacterium]
MDLSLFMNPIHPLDRAYLHTLREDRETVILADRLGFKDAFIGEHVTDKAENITNSALFLASLASDTRTIRLGTGTANLPQSHPALIAGHIAMLDHLLEGRFNFGISQGILASDSEALEITHGERDAMFLEAIDHILALWTSDPPYRRAGKYWSITTEKTQNPEIGTGYIQKPYQKPHPPIFGSVINPDSKGLVALAARGWT